MELVEHDGAKSREQRILLEARRQHPLGGHQQVRARAESPFESNLPADLGADRPAALVGDTLRDGARRHAPGLQHDDRPIGEECRRHARRLAGSGLRGDDDGTRSPKGIGNRVDEGVDGKRI
jgi:hypothetical protein